MSEQTVVISEMRAQHVEDVVRIHLQSFPNFFLTFMGAPFLRLLYSEILLAPDHVAFIAQERNDGAIVGFVAGVTQQSDFYLQLVRRRWFSFATASLGALFRRPTILPRLLRALRRPKSSREAVAQALLMSLAVVPDMSGVGIGQGLVNHFLATLKDNGVATVSLTTDRDENARANHFYQRLGFQIARVYETPEGRWLNEYVIDLGSFLPH